MVIVAKDLIINNKKDIIEKMANASGANMEALQTLASMYDKGKLKVTDLEVTGTAKIQDGRIVDSLYFGEKSTRRIQAGGLNGPAGHDWIDIHDANVYIHDIGEFHTDSLNTNTTGIQFIQGQQIYGNRKGWIDVNNASVKFAENTWVAQDAHVSGITKTDRIGCKGLVGAYAINTGWNGVADARIPIMIGTGSIGANTGEIGRNIMDYVIVMPGYRLRLWNATNPPDWNSKGGLFDYTNNGSTPSMHHLNPANVEDFYRLDFVWPHW